MTSLVLVRVTPPVFCSIQAQPPPELIWDSVTVPAPVSVVLLLGARYPLAPLPPKSWMRPSLVMIPFSTVVALLLAV